MPRLAGLFSIPCLVATAIAVESCALPSPSRAVAAPQFIMSCEPDVPQQIDSTVRFEREISSDSTLVPGEIRGIVLSATTGEPVSRAEVSIAYPGHRHTQRTIFGNADGRFRIKGLPEDDGILYAGGDGFHWDSVVVNPHTKPVIRFALHVALIHLRC